MSKAERLVSVAIDSWHGQEAAKRDWTRLRDLLVVGLLALVPLLWFQGRFLAGGDVFPPQRPLQLMQQGLSSWRQYNLGLPNLLDASLFFPYLLLPSILQELGLSPIAIERAWLVLSSFLQGLSMYYLTLATGPELRSRGRLVASGFYMYNPLTLLNPLAYTVSLSFGLMPALLAIAIQGMREQSATRAAQFALTSWLGLSITSNPPTYLITFLPAALYVLFCGLFLQPVRPWRFPLWASALTLGVNGFWISLFLIRFVLYQSGTALSAPVGTEWVTWTSTEATLPNLYRLIGHWSFYRDALGSPYFPYAPLYNSPPLILTGFLLTIAALLVLIRKSPYAGRPEVLYLCGLGLLALFLAKGPNEPLGSVFIYLYNHVPGFWLFREPFAKFLPLTALCLAALLGHVVGCLPDPAARAAARGQWRARLSSILALCAVGLVGLNCWHALTGETIPGDRPGSLPGWRVDLPHYWGQMADYVAGLPAKDRILLVPAAYFYQARFFWPGGGYYGADPSYAYIAHPLVGPVTATVYETFPSAEAVSSLYSGLGHMLDGNGVSAKAAEQNFSDLLRSLDIKYILHRRDLDWTHFGATDTGSPGAVKAALLRVPGLSPRKAFGPLDLYEMEEPYRLGRVYQTAGRAAPEREGRLPTALPFRQVSCTRYEVKITSADPSCFVLAESFHPGWHAYWAQSASGTGAEVAAGGPWWERSALLSWILADRHQAQAWDHSLTEGFSNQWCLPRSGSYMVTLQYTPQRIFEGGMLLSALTVLGCVGVLGARGRGRGGSKALALDSAQRGQGPMSDV